MTTSQVEPKERPRGAALETAPPTEDLFAELKKKADKGLADRGTPRAPK
jgi:hypothetical protein